MKHYFLTRQFFVVFFALSVAAFVLFMSLWRINLAGAGKENRETSVPVSAGTRLHQLFTPPILPDHPLYILGMVTDRLELTLASPSQRFALRLQYANVRLATAQVLVERGRLNLALSTVTKAEKYLIAAAQDVALLPKNEQERARVELVDTISIHKDRLTAIKSSFSDNGRSVVDGLIEQILVLHLNR